MDTQNYKQNKSKLRIELSQKRSALSSLEAEKFNNKITQKLIENVDWRKINKVNLYQAIKSEKEVDVSDLFDFLRQHHPEVHTELAPNKASESQTIPKNKTYDLVIVPVLGFDRSGNRLGYGGGYYDKFLFKNNCRQTIGLAYSFQGVRSLPVEEHDQKLDLIITEEEIIKP